MKRTVERFPNRSSSARVSVVLPLPVPPATPTAIAPTPQSSVRTPAGPAPHPKGATADAGAVRGRRGTRGGWRSGESMGSGEAQEVVVAHGQAVVREVLDES